MKTPQTDGDGLPKTGVGSWKWRRIFLWSVNIFCAYIIFYIVYTKLDTRPADTGMMMAFITQMMSVGSYVFGAAWDDKNKMELLSARIGQQVGGAPIAPSPVMNRPLV